MTNYSISNSSNLQNNFFKTVEFSAKYAKIAAASMTTAVAGVLAFDTANYFGNLNSEWNKANFCSDVMDPIPLFTTARNIAINTDILRKQLEKTLDPNASELNFDTICLQGAENEPSNFKLQALFWLPTTLIVGTLTYKFFQAIEQTAKNYQTPNNCFNREEPPYRILARPHLDGPNLLLHPWMIIEDI